MDIPVFRAESSNRDKVDYTNLGFGTIFTDHMFMATYKDGQWQDSKICPLEEYLVHPGDAGLHYGQSIFEGLKSMSDAAGNPLIFRLADHITRFNRSAERMCMPSVPEELFQEAVSKLVNLDAHWLPQETGSSLYIRPFMLANQPFLGVTPVDEYKFMIILSPVGSFYANPVSLLADDVHVRATIGGVGEAKTAGNYAAALQAAKQAKTKGYEQVLWLDAKENKYVQEVGTMNVFFVHKGEVITPALDGAILHGITRDSFITLLRDKGVVVKEERIGIDFILDEIEKGHITEAFGSGTAVGAMPIKRIGYKGRDVLLDVTAQKIMPMLKSEIMAIKTGEKAVKWPWITTI